MLFAALDFGQHREAALTLIERDQIIELGKPRRGNVEAGVACALGECVGARPVLLCEVAVEVGGAEDILRARFAARGRGDDKGHRLCPAVRGEEDEAEIILRLQMPLLCGAAIPCLRLYEIGRDAAAKLIGLAKVELRIGVARNRKRPPFGDCRLVITRLPGIDAILDVGTGRCRQHRCRDQRQGQ